MARSATRFALQVLDSNPASLRRHYWSREREKLSDLQEHEAGHRVTPTFNTEGVLDFYLDPGAKEGCLQHADPECLCDVDVSKTAGYVWDQVPQELHSVSDAQSLVYGGATIWVNYDLLTDKAHHVRFELLLEMMQDGRLEDVFTELRNGTPLQKIAEKFEISDEEHAFLRKLLGLGRPNPKPVLSIKRLKELLVAGYRNLEIQAILKEETGFTYSRSHISHTRARLGHKPLPRQKSGRARQYDYARIYGMSKSGMSVADIAAVLESEGKKHRVATIQGIIWDERRAERDGGNADADAVGIGR